MNIAILLSAFVCPGLGHIVLNKYPMGISLITASAIALLILLYNLAQHATDIIKKIQSGDIAPLDIDRIIEMITQSDTLQMQIATSVLLILWVIGIVDSYRLSRQESKKETKKIIPIKSIK